MKKKKMNSRKIKKNSKQSEATQLQSYILALAQKDAFTQKQLKQLRSNIILEDKKKAPTEKVTIRSCHSGKP